MYILDIIQTSKWYLFIEHFLNISLENSLQTVKNLENSLTLVLELHIHRSYF